MTNSLDPNDDSPDPDDNQLFENALTGLLKRAYENGVDIEGGWKCAFGGNGGYYFDVQITTVEYDSD